MSAIDADFVDQAEVLKIIEESWAAVNTKKGQQGQELEGNDSRADGERKKQESARALKKPNAQEAAGRKTGWFNGWKTSGKENRGASNSIGTEEKEQAEDGKQNNGKAFDIPETFTEMVKLNAAMTGANMTLINIMLDCFNAIVADIVKTGHLAEETDILAMRIAKDVEVPRGGTVKISEFKVCLLASMRSLRGSLWDTKHEKAWNWLWESVAAALHKSLPLPARYEKPVKVFITQTCEMKDLREIGMSSWKRLFEIDAKAESFFKQSNERLIFIAVSAMQFTVKIFDEPSSMHTQMIELGQKHIMNRVDPKYFPMFIDCLTEEIKTRTDDENIIQGVRWGVSVIGSIMARTVEEGSTPLLMAALDNNVKQLKKELNKFPRGKRAEAILGAMQHTTLGR